MARHRILLNRLQQSRTLARLHTVSYHGVFAENAVILMKASGATYRRVAKATAHAFAELPVGIHVDEFVLLSKNRDDCSMLEKQVQHIAKVLSWKEASAEELETMFPGVDAGQRWRWIVELYWVHKLPAPFHLAEVVGLKAIHYATVQAFARLSDDDSLAILNHLQRTNLPSLLDVLNNAERSVRSAS